MKSKNLFSLTTSLLTLIFMLGSCVNIKNVQLLQDKTIKDESAEIYNQRSGPYRINPGDYLYIKVNSTDPKTSKYFNSDLPEYLSPTYLYLRSHSVDNEGYLSFSFMEKIMVKGLTIDEIQKKIQENLDLYFKETTVMIKLAQFQISILGEVGSPGTFSIETQDINILRALSLAGGVNTFGNLKKVKLIRQTLNGNQIHYLDLTDNGLLESQLFYLMPNDMIYVEPRGTKVFTLEKFTYTNIISVLAFGFSALLLVDRISPIF